MNKPKYLSENEIEKIVESGVKLEIDEEIFFDNWSPGDCGTCMLANKCNKPLGANWDQDCQEWDYILTKAK